MVWRKNSTIMKNSAHVFRLLWKRRSMSAGVGIKGSSLALMSWSGRKQKTTKRGEQWHSHSLILMCLSTAVAALPTAGAF